MCENKPLAIILPCLHQSKAKGVICPLSVSKIERRRGGEDIFTAVDRVVNFELLKAETRKGRLSM